MRPLRPRFQPGDVLLKIDVSMRPYVPFDTRHHVMLIIDVDRDNHPIVAHMKFVNKAERTGYLVIETCPSTSDIFCIQVPQMTAAIRSLLRDQAIRLEQSNTLHISRDYLEKQYQQASIYRDGCRILVRSVLEQPRSVIPFDSFTEPVMLSCHEFVFGLIQFVFHLQQVELPPSLSISPGLAWSDIIFACLQIDKTLSFYETRVFSRTSNTVSQQSIFHAPPEQTNLLQQIIGPSCQNICHLM